MQYLILIICLAFGVMGCNQKKNSKNIKPATQTSNTHSSKVFFVIWPKLAWPNLNYGSVPHFSPLLQPFFFAWQNFGWGRIWQQIYTKFWQTRRFKHLTRCTCKYAHHEHVLLKYMSGFAQASSTNAVFTSGARRKSPTLWFWPIFFGL